MTKQDILDAATYLGTEFVRWLGFELSHEDVTDRHGNIRSENIDSGGTTFAGIDRSSHPHFPYSHPTAEAVIGAYKKDWDGVRAGEMPGPVAAVVANDAVNMGHGGAVRLLQGSLGVPITGTVDDRTIDATKHGDPHEIALNIISKGDERYKHLASHGLRRFLATWLRRDRDLRKEVS